MIAREISQNANDLYEAGTLQKVIELLLSQDLDKTSSKPRLNHLFSGQQSTQEKVSNLLKLWSDKFPHKTSQDIALLLGSVFETIKSERKKSTKVELVWTGPSGKKEHPRLTRQVVQDIINDSRINLMIAGYWIAGPQDGEGIVGDIIELLVKAVQRGVNLIMILDQNPKYYGGTNEEVIKDLWAENVPLPKMVVWPKVSEENHLKMHAKLIVGDQKDALVTSANLTMHALDKNIEMGVRLKGVPAGKISSHLESLIDEEILVFL